MRTYRGAEYGHLEVEEMLLEAEIQVLYSLNVVAVLTSEWDVKFLRMKQVWRGAKSVKSDSASVEVW